MVLLSFLEHFCTSTCTRSLPRAFGPRNDMVVLHFRNQRSTQSTKVVGGAVRRAANLNRNDCRWQSYRYKYDPALRIALFNPLNNYLDFQAKKCRCQMTAAQLHYFCGGINSKRSPISHSRTVHSRARTSISSLVISLLQ